MCIVFATNGYFCFVPTKLLIRGGWPAGLITISSVYLVYIVELILVLNMLEISAAGR